MKVRITRRVALDFQRTDNPVLARMSEPGIYELSASEVEELSKEAEYQSEETDDPLSVGVRRAYARLLSALRGK